MYIDAKVSGQMAMSEKEKKNNAIDEVSKKFENDSQFIRSRNHKI